MRPLWLLLCVGCGPAAAAAAPEPHLAAAPWLRPASASSAAPEAPPPKEVIHIAPPHEPTFTGGKKIDLDVVGADVRDVCRLIAEVAQVNIVVADDVTGTVTLKLARVPWRDALMAVLVAKGLRLEQVGTVFIVRR